MTSNYELRKRSVDPEAAAIIFSQDFATKAFEEGLHNSRRPSEAKANRPRLPADVVSWIAVEGRQTLAYACLAYLFAFEMKTDVSEDRSFVGLIRQVRDGAKQIAVAADTLADQLQRHHRETGAIDPVRNRALIELAASLNAEVLSAEDLLPSPEGGFLHGVTLRHGLRNCRRLADHADDFLDRYRTYAEIMRAEGKKALEMQTGNRTDADRDAFIEDLAAIYKQAIGKDAKAREGSGTTGHAPAPFVRFVRYVFSELKNICSQIGACEYLETPSSHVIRAVVERSAAVV
ncbi:hypothetical protein V6R86_00375 [Sphingomonas kaistensis]|uniref:Uncharacterized protein n=1 Tax=Sphingomonas kaistensis TaxID=298708 RepID=A0ABZ2G0A4_9SPHN